MMKKFRWLYTYISTWRIIPAYLFLCFNRFHAVCQMDLNEWIRFCAAVKGHSRFWQFGFLLVNHKECRNIFLNRLHRNPMMFLITRICFPPLESCYINMPPENIGGGFSLQHGFSTIISAKRIGENCRIFQQVTVGFREDQYPVIGDRVVICAGAIVIGGIELGDDACVGAGAVVTHDVPEGKTVAGVPARIIK